MLVEIAVVGFMGFYFISSFVSALYGAPFVPMERHRLQALLKFSEVGSGDRFYDLGSGDGRVLAAALAFGVQSATGFEAAPWPYLKSRFKTRKLENCKINHQTFMDADLSRATCVYAYLFPKLMDRLAGKLEKNLSSGARVIAPAFEIDTQKHPGLRLKKTEKIGTLTAYLYEKI